jgi:sodium/bile acid cotransporter 7
LAGLALRTEEFVHAFKEMYFNTFVQIFNFGVVSSIVFGFSRLMIQIGAISQVLGDGMAICGSLSITVNMCVVMTVSAGGGKDSMKIIFRFIHFITLFSLYLLDLPTDEAAAIFNTAFGNMIGIFLSPFLILGYIGVSGNVPIGTTFYKLAVRVILPLFIGQVVRKTSKGLVAFVKTHKPYFAKAQEYALVFIIYTIFCQTFSKDHNSNIGDIFLLILFQFILLCTVMALAWHLLKVLFPNQPKLRVMGLFGCTQKTVAVGIPLISAIYQGNPNSGLYTLPLLIWHPMQIILGSALTPRLKAFVEAENERLGIVDKNPETSEPTGSESDVADAEAQVVHTTTKP